jgi:hypothetical protein
MGRKASTHRAHELLVCFRAIMFRREDAGWMRAPGPSSGPFRRPTATRAR